MEEALPSAIGQLIGAYRLESVIGRGGMGCVYLARHVLLGRRAAVKVLWSQFAGDAQYVSRLFQEAKVVNDVRHPNIVDVIDFIITDNPPQVACVMEHLEGASLSQMLMRGPLTPVQAANLMLQLATALSAVHAVGVIHRDLKPDNVMVLDATDDDFSLTPSAKILDFGIAKTATPGLAHQTATGWLLGTPRYMAPEQIRTSPVSPATDVYALGEILYEMILARPMYPGSVPEIINSKISNAALPIVLPPGLAGGEEIRSLICDCTQHSPLNRPTISEIRERLQRLLETLPQTGARGGKGKHAATRRSAEAQRLFTTVRPSFNEQAEERAEEQAHVQPFASSTTLSPLLGSVRPWVDRWKDWVGITLLILAAGVAGYLSKRVEAPTSSPIHEPPRLTAPKVEGRAAEESSAGEPRAESAPSALRVAEPSGTTTSAAKADLPEAKEPEPSGRTDGMVELPPSSPPAKRVEPTERMVESPPSSPAVKRVEPTERMVESPPSSPAVKRVEPTEHKVEPPPSSPAAKRVEPPKPMKPAAKAGPRPKERDDKRKGLFTEDY